MRTSRLPHNHEPYLAEVPSTERVRDPQRTSSMEVRRTITLHLSYMCHGARDYELVSNRDNM